MNITKKSFLKIFLILVLLTTIVTTAIVYYGYRKIYLPNIDLQDKDFMYIYIPTGADYQMVCDTLEKYKILKDEKSFKWVSEKKKYPKKVKAGKYKILNNMSNNELVNMLRSGEQEAVTVTFNNVRTKEELASKLAMNIEIDSLEIINLLNNKEFVDSLGFTTTTIISMFIPNTYEYYWNTSARQLIKRLSAEYNKFWTPQRIEKAEKIGMTKLEVSVLASIVQAEQSLHKEEQPIIAGLYINRLQKNIPLQSDPTLVYASGDFTIKRVLNKHKEIDSPYNTYKYNGLLPSPICLPEISALEAVLDYQKNDFIFMCAKEDFSGYHYFATTNSQHEVYARRYQNALNLLGIK